MLKCRVHGSQGYECGDVGHIAKFCPRRAHKGKGKSKGREPENNFNDKCCLDCTRREEHAVHTYHFIVVAHARQQWNWRLERVAIVLRFPLRWIWPPGKVLPAQRQGRARNLCLGCNHGTLSRIMCDSFECACARLKVLSVARLATFDTSVRIETARAKAKKETGKAANAAGTMNTNNLRNGCSSERFG